MKIYTHIGNNPILDRAVQKEVFKMGVAWTSGVTKYDDRIMKQLLHPEEYCLYYNNSEGLAWGNKNGGGHEMVSIPEFLNKIQEDTKKKVFTIQLNSEYSAVWIEGENTIKVGCQTFEVDKVLELAKVIEENT